MNDRAGKVAMHVLRVDTAQRTVALGLLISHLTTRTPLSDLAAGHPDLVAAVNLGYFDFRAGAPVGPLVDRGRPVVMSTAHRVAMGIDQAGRAVATTTWLRASIRAGHRVLRVTAVNALRPPLGLVVYTHRWGSQPLNGLGERSRIVTAAGHSRPIGVHHVVPQHGYLVVANGEKALGDLVALGTRHKVTLSASVRSAAHTQLRQAFSVGTQLVVNGNKPPHHHFTCNSYMTPSPARTAIGYADHGKQLILAVVSSHTGTKLHGLDNAQMSRLMIELGAQRAYQLDGSGSSEMVARLRGTGQLSIRNYCSDGQQRPMPLGLGLFSHS